MVASLSKMWSMINGMQIMAYLPLFFVKLPANASLFNKKIIDIVSFSVIPTDEINWILFFLPEVEPFNLNF